MSRISLGLLSVFTVVVQTACDKAPDGSLRFPGQPKIENRWQAPAEVTDFTKLYSKYCLACHSIDNTSVSPAVAMDNPDYLSIVPEETLRNAIANGIPGSLMPGFSKKAGGDMTNEQVDILVKGILAKKPATVDPAVPTYTGPAGNVDAGKALYDQSIYAKTKDVAQSIIGAAYLGTVSDQYIRTLMIAGLPQIGYPDFRGIVPGKVLTNQDVSDLTAWIISNRKNEYGQPLVAPGATPAPGLPAVPPAPSSSAAEQVP